MQQNHTNLLPWAIAVTLCCCLPVGIYGIVQSSKANEMAKNGDLIGAIEVNKSAKMWLLIGAGVGLAFQAIYFGGSILVAILGA